MINRGGEKISAEEVENLVHELPTSPRSPPWRCPTRSWASGSASTSCPGRGHASRWTMSGPHGGPRRRAVQVARATSCWSRSCRDQGRQDRQEGVARRHRRPDGRERAELADRSETSRPWLDAGGHGPAARRRGQARRRRPPRPQYAAGLEPRARHRTPRPQRRSARRLATWARPASRRPMYTGREQRAADIERSAALPGDTLRAQLADTAAALDRTDGSTAAQWEAKVRSALGRAIPAAELPWMRIREVWLHAVDLNTGRAWTTSPPRWSTCSSTTSPRPCPPGTTVPLFNSPRPTATGPGRSVDRPPRRCPEPPPISRAG